MIRPRFNRGGVQTIGRGGTTFILANDPSLTLDLQFANDRAFTARRGPLPTFTRPLATATFVGSNGLIQSAGADVPRINYNPATLQCLGLLLEEQRSNLYTYSGDFLNAVWATGYTKTGGFTAPDGSASAVQFSGASAAISARSVVTTSTAVTISIWLKDVSRTQAISLLVRNDTTSTNLSSASYNAATGTFVTPSPAASWSAQQFPNGWYRVTVVQSTGISVGDSIRFYYGNTGVAPDQGAYLLWGAQFETGAFATSYIPTTTASVTRNADVCSISGANFTSFWNQSEGTLVLDMIKSYTVPVTIAQINYLSANDGTLNNYIQFAQRSTGVTGEVFRCEVGGTSQAVFAGGPLNAINTSFRIGGAYKLNDFASAINGSDCSIDNTGTIPTLNRLDFVTVTSSNHIRSLQYYNVRKTNTELTRLTRLPTLDPALTLDLQFALDAAYFSRLGPLPTFTNASVSSRTFVGSNGLIQSAATNVARIDFDPVTLVCRGLLIEEQRQNLCIWSEDTTQAAWVKTAVTAAANTATAPDGNSSADTLAETIANSQHYIAIPLATISSGTTYTFSCFVKKGSGATAPDWILFSFPFSNFGSRSVAFNVSTGAFGSSLGGTSLAFSVSQFQNGWFRVSLTAAATAGGSPNPAFISFTNNTNTATAPTYTGQTTSNLLVWGAQFETGFGVTSYIPTTTSAFTRSADVCTITGAAFTRFFNPVESSVVVKFRRSTHAVSHTTLAIDDNTVNERMINVFQSGIDRFGVADTGGTTNNLDGGAVGAVGSLVGHAYRAKANDFAVSFNGNAPIVNTTQTMPTVNQMTIGYRNGANYINGWIHSIQYYTNAKTDAQLQALSTP